MTNRALLRELDVHGDKPCRQRTVSVTAVLPEHPQFYRTSYSLTVPTTPRYVAEILGTVCIGIHLYTAGYVIRHQYVILPGIVCLAFDNVLLPGIVCSAFDNVLLQGIVWSAFGNFCGLLLYLIQLGVCYFAELYFRGLLPARAIDSKTLVRVVTLTTTPPLHLPFDFIIC
ncbi:hypothetical protein DPMN_142706, partial [Dreissena polymorpha]